MGVTILQQYPLKDRTGPQTVDYLAKKLTTIGGKQVGQFVVECETYFSTVQLMGGPGPMRTMHVLHNSEQPASVFAVLETGTKTISIVADLIFDLLMLKVTGVYATKKQQKIEVRGPRFEILDFRVKVGMVSVGQNFKGVLLEVELKTCDVVNNCWELMKEFMQGLLDVPCNLSAPPPYLQSRMNDVYQPIDTIQQYLEHFSMFRKATGILQYNNN